MRGYDAIVVGARCAGAPTAMLLARKGSRVLVVDQASFPSDTVSTHVIHAPGVAALRRWGCSTRVASGCPPIETGTRSTSGRSRSPARRGPPTALRRPTRPAERSSTRSSSTPRTGRG